MLRKDYMKEHTKEGKTEEGLYEGRAIRRKDYTKEGRTEGRTIRSSIRRKE
jgi:hypothetical protein